MTWRERIQQGFRGHLAKTLTSGHSPSREDQFRDHLAGIMAEPVFSTIHRLMAPPQSSRPFPIPNSVKLQYLSNLRDRALPYSQPVPYHSSAEDALNDSVDWYRSRIGDILTILHHSQSTSYPPLPWWLRWLGVARFGPFRRAKSIGALVLSAADLERIWTVAGVYEAYPSVSPDFHPNLRIQPLLEESLAQSRAEIESQIDSGEFFKILDIDKDPDPK